jgi:hypothetical protein
MLHLMIKKMLFGLLMLAIGNISFCQKKTEAFSFIKPNDFIPAAFSYYKTIDFLDSRIEKRNMGIVQLGVMNAKALVVPDPALPEQFQTMLDEVNGDTVGANSLLLQLRDFRFAELTSSFKEEGWCYLRANLYTKEQTSCQLLAVLDTLIYFTAGDVTKSLLKKSSATLYTFLKENVVRKPADTASINFADVQNIDNLEKSKIMLYNTTSFVNGVYKTYNGFKDQKPDVPDFAISYDGNNHIKEVALTDNNGKLKRMKPADYYAIVKDGNMFIATEFGWYPLKKIDNDFYFLGKAKTSANSGNVIAAGVAFGLIGSLIASSASAEFVDMRIDHLNGGFIVERKPK